MEYAIGVLVALAVCAFARGTTFDRDRAFYPTVLIVTASYYVLFAALFGDAAHLAGEAAIALGFTGLAVLGFARNARLLVIGLAAHALYDIAHGLLGVHSGQPPGWRGFCLAFDLAAAAWLAWPQRATGRPAITGAA